MGNTAQRDYWSGDVGARWAGLAGEIDATFAEVTAAIVVRAVLAAGSEVLDVGCGAGSLSRAALASVGGEGRVTGIDISPPLLAAARARSDGRIGFLEVDAETHGFAPELFDAVISQFGLMFFTDTVAAFANLRRAARPGARLTFAAWSDAEANPWFAVPRAIAVAALGPLDSDPDGPGPMRFRDIAQVCRWLAAAGWHDMGGEPVDLALTPAGGRDDVGRFATRLGGAAAVIGHYQADDGAREDIAARIAEAFAPYAQAGAMRVPARVNVFTARA